MLNIYNVAAIIPIYRFYRASERDESGFSIDIQERIKYASSYAIDLSMMDIHIRKYSNYKDKCIWTHKYFIYRGYVRINKTLMIILTSLSYVITVINVVKIGVIGRTLYSQRSYTRRVHTHT